MEEGILMIIAILVFVIVIVGMITTFHFDELERNKEECHKFGNQYNLVIEKDFSNWNDLSENYCKVVMTDGTKVDIEDFNIAVIKTPLKREVTKWE